MARLLVGSGQRGDAFDQGLHRPEGLLVGHDPRGKRPDIAKRHGAEAACRLAGSGADGAFDVDQRGAIASDAAELDRRAVDKVLVAVGDFLDADVGRFGHGEKLHYQPRR